VQLRERGKIYIWQAVAGFLKEGRFLARRKMSLLRSGAAASRLFTRYRGHALPGAVRYKAGITQPTGDRLAKGLLGKQEAKEVLDEDGNIVVYRGPFQDVVKKVKVFSICSCAMTTTLGPLIAVINDPSASMSLAAQVGMGGTIVFFGLSTTVFLAWFLNPLVVRLLLTPDKSHYIVEKWDIFLRSKFCKFRRGEQKPIDVLRPLANFGVGKQHFYLVSEMTRHDMVKKDFPWIFENEPAQEEVDLAASRSTPDPSQSPSRKGDS